MSRDPNNKKWTEDESRKGLHMMKKQGWDGQKGLGKNEDGLQSHVRVTKKDDTLGIGYDGAVAKNQVWSQQAANFADILKRVNNKDSSSDDDDEGSGSDNNNNDNGEVKAVVGKSGSLFAKRRTLKTGALNSAEGKAEILGSKRQRVVESSSDSDDSDDDKPKKNQMNLKSKMLVRLMLRHEAHEPKSNIEDQGARIIVTKPSVKPAKVTATPFLE